MSEKGFVGEALKHSELSWERRQSPSFQMHWRQARLQKRRHVGGRAAGKRGSAPLVRRRSRATHKAPLHTCRKAAARLCSTSSSQGWGSTVTEQRLNEGMPDGWAPDECSVVFCCRMTCRIFCWLICGIKSFWPLFFLARGVQTVRKAQTLKKKTGQNKTCLIPVAPTQRTRWRWTSVSVSHLFLPSTCVDLCWNSPWDTCHLILQEEAGHTSDGGTAASLGVETPVWVCRGAMAHCPLGACAEEERPQLWKDEPVLSFVESMSALSQTKHLKA